MFRKIVFAFCLIASLIVTSGSAAYVNHQKLPVFTQVFASPLPTNGWSDLYGKPVQFRSAMYIASDSSAGLQIWRSFDGKSFQPAGDGNYGVDPANNMSFDKAVFKGKLYIPAVCFPEGNPCPDSMLLRSANGTNWEKIPLDKAPYMLDKLGEFNGMLYATTIFGNGANSGGHIWRSPNGDAGTWTMVKDLDPGVWSTSSPVVFHGRIYLTAFSWDSSIPLWSSKDGLNWERDSVPFVTGDMSTAWLLRDGTLAVIHGELYLTTYNTVDGGAILRSRDAKKWDKVFQLAPDSSGKAVVGFSDLIAFDGDLYAAAAYETNNQIPWNPMGTQIWRSHSGNPGSWEKITDDAKWASRFPDRGALSIYKDHLYFQDTGFFAVQGGLYRMENR